MGLAHAWRRQGMWATAVTLLVPAALAVARRPAPAGAAAPAPAAQPAPPGAPAHGPIHQTAAPVAHTVGTLPAVGPAGEGAVDAVLDIIEPGGSARLIPKR